MHVLATSVSTVGSTGPAAPTSARETRLPGSTPLGVQRTNRLSLCRGIGIVLVLTFGVLGFPCAATAGPLRIVYRLNNDAATPRFIGDVVPATDTLAPVTLEGTIGQTFATTTVRVDHGSLGLFGFVRGGALVVSEVDFEDTLTLASDTLSAGTAVSLAVALDLDYALSSSSCEDGTGVARIDARVRLGSNTLHFADDSCAGLAADDGTAVMTFAVGDQIDLYVQLEVTAAAGNCCQPGFAEANALNTLRFFVDPQGTDFTYTSLTGRTYLSPTSTPVPEPLTGALLAGGAAGWLARRARRVRAPILDR